MAELPNSSPPPKANTKGQEPDQLSPEDKKLVTLLSSDLSLTPKPYAQLAAELDLTENEVIEKVADLSRRGLIRRLGAVVAHQKSGYKANAMIVWLMPEDRLDEVGEMFAGLPYVSHCYQRRPVADWPYNLYTMIHAQDRERLMAQAQNMADMSGAQKWRILESLKEFKKESLRLTF
ncbi:MAG: Lrp/AsnC family transcriptional regulator [Deltaproteobacteria bacterium]|jgi:DNA-binding Lrp family transcriptional regulator|nr:Lrp/AsnC family transcriptional regulator [Deltaproteobacteria bacterium]